ncbi:hypothetical protein BCR42DRAFT_19176 [Absidia repens]|uniref:RING-CH-type domain-containing protein n=1 Tax=Absidia repens TaxID=90262 RepID=A0A1X2J2G3_9FUNG|nr:hypothetical protein BCR42DRAFT_19176 [Absidia repens]
MSYSSRFDALDLTGLSLNTNDHTNISTMPASLSNMTQPMDDGSNTTTEQRCWICFGEDNDSVGRWVKPCPCSLVSHEQCLLDWITENQKGRSPMKKVFCPQCAMPYYLFERRSVSLRCLEFIQSLARSTAPYMMVVGLGCSILVAASTYGAYSVMTLFGAKEGERLLGPTNTWTWRTFLGLPSIPFVLVASRSRFADGILPVAAILFLRASAPMAVSWPPSPALIVGSLPWIRLVYFTFYSLVRRHLSSKLSIQPPTTNRRPSRYARLSLYRYQEQPQTDNTDSPNRSSLTTSTTERQVTREQSTSTSSRDSQDADLLYGRSNRDLNVTIMGALLWPTISGVIGNFLKHIKYIRHYLPEAFHRNILGGCLFILAKVIDKISIINKFKLLTLFFLVGDTIRI